MYQDVEKFINLLNTDVSLQERMKDAAEKYDGKQTPEAAFQDLISPFAKEAGFDFNLEDYKEFMKQKAGEAKVLDLEEMEQVAGGDEKGGTALTLCYVFGLGAGVTANIKENGSFKVLSECFVIGYGSTSACAYYGATTD